MDIYEVFKFVEKGYTMKRDSKDIFVTNFSDIENLLIEDKKATDWVLCDKRE